MSLSFAKILAALLGAVLLTGCSATGVFENQLRDLLDPAMIARSQKEYVPGSMELFVAADTLPGRVEFSLSASETCAYAAQSQTVQTDSCLAHEDISYKVQLATDSCAGLTIQYFHDKDCTLFAGSKAIQASKLACRQVSTDGGFTYSYASVACYAGGAKAAELNLLTDTLSLTPDPSAEPSAPPTAVPTLAPSAFPSAASAVLVVFTAKQTINGITLTVYQSNPNNEVVLKKAVASVMTGVTVDDLKDWTVKEGPARRRLASHRLGRGFQTLADSIEVSYTVQTMSQLSSQELQSQLITATEDGTFDTNLQAFAATDDAPDLLTATSDPATTAEPSTGGGGSDSSNKLSEGGIAGVVIGVVFGVILLGLLVYYFVVAPKGGNAASGEEYTVAL